MATESAPTVLIVRSFADLERASTEVTAFLALRQRHSPRMAALDILGVWFDEEDAMHPPSELLLSDAIGAQPAIPLREATGVGGIWMLCRLECAAGSVSRADLVAALLRSHARFATRNVARAACFMPVFASTTPERAQRAEMELLRAHPAPVVMPAGRVRWPPGSGASAFGWDVAAPPARRWH